MNTKTKKSNSKRKIYTTGIALFFAVALILGIKSAYAYYHQEDSKSIFSIAVGDFDTGDGDINIMLYKETKKGSDQYTRTYAVPAEGYKFMSDKTSCSYENTKVDCSYNDSGSGKDCNYTYDEATRTFNLTSKKRVTCKFYFDLEYESDIDVYIMMQDANGVDKDWKGNKYTLVNEIPAYGYAFAGYTCDKTNEGDKVEFDPITKRFTVSTATKNKCYAYFDSVGSSDVVANVYVQKDKDKASYVLVNSIPANKTYQLKEESSKCYKYSDTSSKGQELKDVTISYDGGYINIDNIGEKVVCDVYLDLAN